jgi:uncharacterized damage-inducible protein DinB
MGGPDSTPAGRTSPLRRVDQPWSTAERFARPPRGRVPPPGRSNRLHGRTPHRSVDELTILRQWYRFNAEGRSRYLDAIAKLPVRLRRYNDGASFPLLEIYLHVLDAYRWWLRFVYRDEVRRYPAARLRTTVRRLSEARRASARVGREINAFVGRLRPSDLDRTIEFDAPADDAWTHWRRERVTLRAMLWHLVEEELQHRGEMNALLWRHGVEPPLLEFHAWSRGWGVAGSPRTRGGGTPPIRATRRPRSSPSAPSRPGASRGSPSPSRR